MKISTFNTKLAAHAALAEMRARMIAADPLTTRLCALNDRVDTNISYGVAVKQGHYQATLWTDSGTEGLGWYNTRVEAVIACERHEP